MDIAAYQNCQELGCQLYDILQTNLEPLYNIVYKSNATDMTENWTKVLQEFPEEIKTMSVTSAFKSNYKKTIGIYLYHVLRKQNVTSVASAHVFLQKFMKNFMRHPRMQPTAAGPSFFHGGQLFFAKNGDHGSDSAFHCTNGGRDGAARGQNRTEVSVISTKLETKIKNRQREKEHSVRLPRHRSSHSYFEGQSKPPSQDERNQPVGRAQVQGFCLHTPVQYARWGPGTGSCRDLHPPY